MESVTERKASLPAIGGTAPRVRRVVQMVFNMSEADAVTGHVLQIDRMLAELGVETSIYCENAHPALKSISRSYLDYRPADPPDGVVLLFHFSIGSEIGRFFARAPAWRKVLVYHNLTPPEFYDGVNRRVAALLREGREELREIAGAVDLALGVSEVNRAELGAAGFRRTGVLPFSFSSTRTATKPDPEVARRFGDGALNVLHVGRIAPNKRIEDLVKVFYFLKRKIRPASRLLLAGTDNDTELYSMALAEMALGLGLEDVIFLGQVPDEALAALYSVSSVYLCMSEHEGFCVPILEAMHFGLPVVTHPCPGVAETLGASGVAARERRHDLIAEMIELLHADGRLRGAVVERQRGRLGDFSPDRVARLLRGHLASLA